MLNSSSFLMVILSLNQFMVREVACDPECDVSSTGRILNLSINSKRNTTGEWVTTFSARKDSNGTSNDIDLDLTHKFAECDGKSTVHIQGVIREMAIKYHKGDLFFHENCGSNVRITDYGRSAEKIDLDEGLEGVVFTNRMLRIDEIFEISLKKKNSKFGNSIGIGVTTQSPGDLKIPKHANYLNSGIWMMYQGNIYQNGSLIKSGYMKDPKELNVGDRVGVMRKESGHLHIYINGIDQGTAASNVPHPIYGVFELYYDTAKVTITDATWTSQLMKDL